MPPDGGEQPEWARAAEELVRRVRNLVEDHGDAVERALTESLGSRDAARAEIRKLELLAQVLDLELWRRGEVKPSRKLVGYVASAALGALALVGVQTTNLVTTDVYEAITGTQAQAETVAQQCDVDVDVDVFTLDHGQLDTGDVLAQAGTAEAAATAQDPAVVRTFSGGFSEPFYTGGSGVSADEISAAETDTVTWEADAGDGVVQGGSVDVNRRRPGPADETDDVEHEGNEPIEAAPYGRSTDPGRRYPRSYPPSEGRGSIDGALDDSP